MFEDILIFGNAAFSFIYMNGAGGFFGALAIIFVILLGLNFSGKFKTAIEELIEANPTSISNPVVFTVFGVLLFVAVLGMTLAGLVSYIGTFSDRMDWVGPGLWMLLDLVTIVLTAMIGFSVAGLYFQPERANVKVDKSSSVAEDVIALASFGLKIPLCFAAMFSNALIVLGVLTVLGGLGDYFSEAGYWGGLGVQSGLTYFVLGAFAPFLFYLAFLVVFPIFNFWLAILHIPKIGKK